MLTFPRNIKSRQIEALSLISANVMLADHNLQILYLNAAVQKLLHDAEPDLRKELPAFSVEKLVGANIDVFHKHPQHQRDLLTSLKRRHRATISVANRKFDLVVTPMSESGFVVEWFDARERLENEDYRGQLEAISRAQAVIEFLPDGTITRVNDNFLAATGYRREDLIGRNHRMFLADGASGDAEYQTLWQTLRSNRPFFGDIVRYGRGQKRVLLNASYNPIADREGRVTKIIKFAFDVSSRMQATERLAEALAQLEGGNIDAAIGEAFGPEFEKLRLSFNSAVQQLGRTLLEVASATSRIQTGSDEMSQATYHFSQRAERQAAALEQTAAALDEITANVANATKNTEEARKAATEVRANADRSGVVVRDAVDAMSRIKDSSKQIADIIGVIDEIAFQTNLLALNAGVEAARAGEAGKGFAVVAQEVRELAQRSAKAAKEIKELISRSGREVSAGVSLVNETGAALELIQQNITSITTSMDAIANSAQEQSVGLREINSAINQMDQTTQQNAAMVEQSSAASSALAEEGRYLQHLIKEFRLPARIIPVQSACIEPEEHPDRKAPRQITGQPSLKIVATRNR